MTIILNDLDQCYSDGYEDAASAKPDRSAEYQHRKGQIAYRNGYLLGVEHRLRVSGVTMRQYKRDDEDTRLFRAWQVAIFRRDATYWIVPVERGVIGVEVDRDSLDIARSPLPTLINYHNAPWNATRCDDDEARQVLDRFNARYHTRARLVTSETVWYE